MSATLERRVRQYRSRMLIRAFDYRQRHHAAGVWFRLRRLLAGTSQAYVVSESDANQLRQEGFRVEPVGREVDPPKTIVVAPAQRVAALASARAVPVTLGSELLSATYLVLVPFDPL
jgi:hypothetical protein